MQTVAILVSVVAMIVWLLTYWRGGTAVVKSMQQSTLPLDRLAVWVLAFTTAALPIIGLAMLLGLGTPLLPEWAALIGMIMVLLGMAGTYFCRAYLGKYWAAEAALQRDHSLVDSGPYGVVRHPIYTMAIILYIGLGIVFSAPLGSLAAFLSTLMMILKTGVEDRFLSAELEGYAAYSQRVPYRLLPKIW
ncbi:MAG: isoprenylcysteine carboxylmethyltransferase family protein [Chloroflexi bacterium CFX4]|nr:isoprenylcysteine carboxylmethyltransferase family protein [Chloroflexi bacterium CFX4]MDL1923100.1 isoprenylcysteine carboxylmethyltransferase family protein [Chloroflexi bacterium CFX3]